MNRTYATIKKLFVEIQYTLIARPKGVVYGMPFGYTLWDKVHPPRQGA
ncbi:MAG: hypothetical protein HFI76_07980 [Lachnospiraceae bacterium]|nr:hypothetical protein [Lachnospiraceae bacterium]